ILEDSGARKIATKSGREIQLKGVSYDLQNLATEGLVLNNIMLLENADVEMNKKHVHKDDDDGNKDGDNDDDDRMFDEENEEDKDGHKKIIGNDVHAYKPSHVDHNHLKDTIPSLSQTLSPSEGHERRLERTKFCAISFESLLDFTHYLSGSNAQLKVLTTVHVTNSTARIQNYTISEAKVISVPNIVGCFPLPDPYAVFYCHSQQSDTNLYEVLVEAICHIDTSKWDPDHVHKVELGTSFNLDW
ncbi:BURP domain-containing protein BNM2A, partial [Mucuna pruriens]